MSIELLIALLAFALVTSVTPGPNNLMLLASGANFGAVRTIPHLAGITIGFQFMLILVGIGLVRLFDAAPASYVVLKIASAAFLAYLAWKIATAAAPGDDVGDDGGDNGGGARGRPLTFVQAAAFQWVNPKAWALSLAALSAYAVPERPVLSHAAIGGAFILAGLPSILAWTFLGTQIRRLLNNPARLRAFNWTCAALLLATLWPILSAV